MRLLQICNFYSVLLFVVLSSNFTRAQSKTGILALGDSNGAFEYGWVNQLQQLLPDSIIYNTSKPGNTVGFDNLGYSNLNTLKNMDKYLLAAEDCMHTIDLVIIMLGTNDSKKIFKDRQKEVVHNMNSLVDQIEKFRYNSGQRPKVILVAPPPFGEDIMLQEKYRGGKKRVKKLSARYKRLAARRNLIFIDMFNELKQSFYLYSKDGVHLDKYGQKLIAGKIVNVIRNGKLLRK